jgi:ABC-type glycerol-3-phosphate transport system substrate-binding protein
MVIGDKTFYSRRQFLTGAAAVAGSAILAACGGGTAIPTSGANPGCKPIRKMIATNNSQIQNLQRQKANTSDPAKKAQIDTQIAGIRQDIASLQQQAKQLGCP